MLYMSMYTFQVVITIRFLRAICFYCYLYIYVSLYIIILNSMFQFQSILIPLSW